MNHDGIFFIQHHIDSAFLRVFVNLTKAKDAVIIVY